MRIQHNIMAMNAYRNYNTNTKALSGNLEKLSSGYKINRAGDDAAGLAISEKMRAQITGLDAAQKNVKDGISLVKTAEGAMQEIQDMLNRMDYLATQSANGTYQDEVDRENLQKEVTALKTEINRIADSANFNGIKLLDGSLASGGAGTSAAAPVVAGLDTETEAAKKGEWSSTAFSDFTAALSDGNELNLTINYTDASGNAKTTTLTVTADKTNNKLITAGGTEIAGSDTVAANAGKFKKEDIADAFVAAIKEDTSLNATFKVSSAANSGQLTFTAREAGANTSVDALIVDFTAAGADKGNAVNAVTPDANKPAADAYEYYKFTDDDIGKVFTVNGQKFAFVNNEAEAAELGSTVNCVKVATEGTLTTTGTTTDITEMVKVIQGKTGAMGVDVDGTDTATINFKAAETGVSGKGGLRLQIGDTADSFNQMMVVVGDMHTKALGIDGVDIGNQDGAADAIQIIKNAINRVSSVRGDLGAVQNRLEHTGNNLSVMAENIQDAESTIRDTDVANEMMSYVKNNILVQSAQAMLAQANQVPQGVLQLLG